MHATSLPARRCWAACAFLLACGVAYAEPIVVERESSLQAEPRVALGRVVGPRQKLNVTSTIGIRGIGSEDLRQARFNEQQIQLLEKSRSTADQARASAASSGLKAVHVNYVE